MRLPALFFFLFSCSFYFSQQSAFLWKAIEDRSEMDGIQQIKPSRFLSYHLEVKAVKNLLSTARHESQRSLNTHAVITLPLADGETADFFVFESDVMSPELKNAFPAIRTYILQGRENRKLSGTLDINDFGLHAMIYTPDGVVFIDPYSNSTTEQYIVYYTHHFKKEIPAQSTPDYLFSDFRNETESERTSAAPICVGSQLRTYRLVIACTGEYAKAATGLSNPTVQQTLSKIVTSVTRVDGIYESELSMRLQLVATTTLVIFTDPASDPFATNAAPTQILDDSQALLNSVIGTANYDIGHTFSAGTSGLATLGCACKNTEKARGTTGLPNPFGDPFDVDFVSHEIGHQFNAKHSYNAITGNCNGQRDASTAVEPGSGITIMGYAGICGTNDLALNSIAYFHTISYDQITTFITSAAGGCAVVSNTGNKTPVVSVTPVHVIPACTPYILSGTATDPDVDALTYSWEEADVATSPGNWNSDFKPYFRSRPPVGVSERSFPTESVVLSGNFTGTRGEYLTSTPQTLQFRLTARDNKTGGGGVCYNTTSVTLVAGGAFKVTYPNLYSIGWAINTQKTITWDVNATASSPVNCDSVRILLSYDEGQNYSVLVGSTPNDGSHTITVPVITGEIKTCRIKIECRNNIFYDVSDFNFTISDDPFVGLQEQSGSSEIYSIAPNPFKDSFTISGFGGKGFYDVAVFNVLGQKVYAQKIASQSDMKIELPEGAAGVYIIRLQSNDGQKLIRAIRE